MSTVAHSSTAVHPARTAAHVIAAPPRRFRPWPPEPGSVADLVHRLRLRGVRVYPDLEGGIGLVAHGVAYDDLRAALVARKAEVVAYLESELWSQRLLELMAFYGWDAERLRVVWLDRLARDGTRHQWPEARIASWIARALEVAETQPEVLVTIGYSTQLVVWYPTMAEVAGFLTELGASEAEILRALRTNNAHHDLRYRDDELAAIARAAVGPARVARRPTGDPDGMDDGEPL